MGLTVVPPLVDVGGRISSSRIRRLLQDGYPERAAAELGRPWAVRGVVAHGDQRGGVANIGRRPTVAAGLESRLEAHLFEYDGDLYGQELSVALLVYIREEQKFADFAALKAQILQDAETARHILQKQPLARLPTPKPDTAP
jgi:riboflavin kinase/FMN adenylyltransferase